MSSSSSVPKKAPPPVPSAFQSQRAMASARMADQMRPDDSASNCSWSVLDGDGFPKSNFPPAVPSASLFPPPAPPQGPTSSSDTGVTFAKAPPKGFSYKGPGGVPLQPNLSAWDEGTEDSDALPEVPSSVKVEVKAMPAAPHAHGLNPATEAAKSALGKKEQQLLDLQKARAKKKGRRGLRWEQVPRVGQTQNYALPHYIQQLGSNSDERSVLIVDSRDQRVQPPFQGWFLDEIMLNSQTGINVLADRNLIRSPISGYHMSMFYVKTIDGFKVILVGSMTSYDTVPCAKWDTATGDVMAHEAFQPFRWPIMRNDSPTWVDVKIKVEDFLLLHLELRGYRSDKDMSVQLNYVHDSVIMNLAEQLFVPSVVVTVFQGWRVVAVSFEVGGRLYACSEGGVVVALDYPLCHFEIRMTSISSKDALGNDADRIDFRFASTGDKIDVACSQLTVPSSYLVVSRVSGPTLKENSAWCRKQNARVEGPDQIMQMSQLAGVHAHWTSAIEAGSEEETGPRVSAVAVGSHPQNLHLTCEAPLFKAQKVTVPKEALALQCHDPEAAQEAMVVPPIRDGPSVVPVSQISSRVKALVGPQSVPMMPGDRVETEISVTEAGQAPAFAPQGDGVIWVPRRSLESRLNEPMATAAVTPTDFVVRVESAVGRPAGGSTSSVPRSLGPQPVVEEIVDL